MRYREHEREGEHKDGDAIKYYIVGARSKQTAEDGQFSEVEGAKIPKWYLQRSRFSINAPRSLHT
jgi:hypothetical protein